MCVIVMMYVLSYVSSQEGLLARAELVLISAETARRATTLFCGLQRLAKGQIICKRRGCRVSKFSSSDAH